MLRTHLCTKNRSHLEAIPGVPSSRALLPPQLCYEAREFDVKTQLKRAGWTASELKRDGFSAAELVQAGFSVAELREAGYGARELLSAGLDLTDLKRAGKGAWAGPTIINF